MAGSPETTEMKPHYAIACLEKTKSIDPVIV